MRRSLRVSVLLLSFALLAPAQVAEVAITGGWSGFSDSTVGTLSQSFGSAPQEVNIDDGVRIGARLSLNRWFLGHEISYAWQKSSLTIAGQDAGGMSIQNYFYNFVVHGTPEGTTIRPFVTAGVGVSTFFPPGASSLSGGGDNKFGYNFGGGLKFRLSDKFGIRFDVRDHVTGRPFENFGVRTADGSFHNVEYSAGFVLLF